MLLLLVTLNILVLLPCREPALARADGLNVLLRSLPTSAILWFCVISFQTWCGLYVQINNFCKSFKHTEFDYVQQSFGIQEGI